MMLRRQSPNPVCSNLVQLTENFQIRSIGEVCTIVVDNSTTISSIKTTHVRNFERLAGRFIDDVVLFKPIRQLDRRLIKVEEIVA